MTLPSLPFAVADQDPFFIYRPQYPHGAAGDEIECPPSSSVPGMCNFDFHGNRCHIYSGGASYLDRPSLISFCISNSGSTAEEESEWAQRVCGLEDTTGR